jgi:hypothetical protein
MSARFIAVALAASILWYAWHRHNSHFSFGGICLRVFAFSLVAGLVGKVFVLAFGLMRHREHCDVHDVWEPGL